MLQHEELTSRPIPLLFLANKMDLAGSSTPEELCEILNLGIVVILMVFCLLTIFIPFFLVFVYFQCPSQIIHGG